MADLIEQASHLYFNKINFYNKLSITFSSVIPSASAL